MAYLDGFVCAVSNFKKQEYIAHASMAAEVFKEYGATQVVECWGDDVPDGELTSFPRAVQCGDEESVVFSWICWPSKQVRDEAWGKVMQDSRLNDENNPMPFDGKRLIYGGFQILFNK